jgi:hypothetical protein
MSNGVKGPGRRDRFCPAGNSGIIRRSNKTMRDDISKEALLQTIKRLLKADDLDFLLELKREDLQRLVVLIREREGGNG